jgi:uncharacterized protein YdeI (YjbR/CyaY-like superfamily)
MTDPRVDDFLKNLSAWKAELTALRELVLSCGFAETFKWRQPCYMVGNQNILVLGNFKNFAALNFFEGSLLSDPHKWLVQPGTFTQTGRYLPLTSVQQIVERTDDLLAYLFEAKDLAEKGVRAVVTAESKRIEWPAEMHALFAEDPAYGMAFEALTPGRQRAYLMHFTGSENPETRRTRLDRYRPRILAGFGQLDCICGQTKKRPGCDGSHRALGPDWAKPFA